MKKKWLLAPMATMILLAACGEDSTKEEATKENAQTAVSSDKTDTEKAKKIMMMFILKITKLN